VLWPHRFAGSEVVAVGLLPSGAAKYYFYWWRGDGTGQVIHDLLRWQVREKKGRPLGAHT